MCLSHGYLSPRAALPLYQANMLLKVSKNGTCLALPWQQQRNDKRVTLVNEYEGGL